VRRGDGRELLERERPIDGEAIRKVLGGGNVGSILGLLR
jgi:hypothetical protein